MLTTPRSRVAAVFALLSLLFGLCVWYGALAPAPELGAHPDQEDLLGQYDAYVGDRATLTGQVVDTDPVTVVVTGAGDSRQLTVTDLSTPVREGETLWVFGVVEPGRTVRAENAFTVGSGGTRYALSASLLAGLWVLARLARQWRFDAEGWALEPRGGERDAPGFGRLRTLAGREDEDA
ncbi:hypothetical protein NGM10_11810 [Halorussus salilacus]|uniref:hypothetical protein n=1 Tax=Halorussus salilacus TaxID=2953750 RepID=UPI00209DF301|nr:hypothetical protein [Halorussus salilacus]USZ67411.1 hypothetical protein NGM10_11810 [Halorussus salilacus]